MTEISAVLAFGAGLLSFLSPCVLPLIPSWLAFIGAGRRDGAAASAFVRTFFFTLGFSAVFVTAGIVFSGIVIFSGARYMDIAAGIIIIVFGLNVIFDFLKFLNYEKRFHAAWRHVPAGGSGGRTAGSAYGPGGRIAGFGGAFLVGAAFGAGWTPCVGPILAGILLLAGQSGKTGLAALYLTLYSAGLGLPFLASALFFDRLPGITGKIKKYLPFIQKAAGILLAAIGILILSGRFRALNALLLRFRNGF